MVMTKIVQAVSSIGTAGAFNGESDKDPSAMFGGELVKAQFVVYDTPALAEAKGKSSKTIEFFINPNTIQVTKEAQLNQEPAPQGTPQAKYSQTYPICLKLGEIWFDTYDTRESVRTKYINDIESLLDFVPNTHYLPVVVFNWGEWQATGKNVSDYKFFVSKVAVDYTLFLPNATPVRAKVDISLEQVKLTSEEVSKESPDHAKLYTVKKGDTLQGIAMAEYDDPREWRRIAKTNNLDDPMELRPGMKLLVPPILK